MECEKVWCNSHATQNRGEYATKCQRCSNFSEFQNSRHKGKTKKEFWEYGPSENFRTMIIKENHLTELYLKWLESGGTIKERLYGFLNDIHSSSYYTTDEEAQRLINIAKRLKCEGK